MDTGAQFLTVTRLVEYILEVYQDCKTIRVVYDPKKSETRNKYGHYQLVPSGLIIEADKTFAISYPKLMEMFGRPIVITVSESKSRRVNPGAQIQLLVIDTELKSFVQKETQDTISYYNSSIVTDKSEISKKLIQSRKEFKEAPKVNPVDDDIDIL